VRMRRSVPVEPSFGMIKGRFQLALGQPVPPSSEWRERERVASRESGAAAAGSLSIPSTILYTRGGRVRFGKSRMKSREPKEMKISQPLSRATQRQRRILDDRTTFPMTCDNDTTES